MNDELITYVPSQVPVPGPVVTRFLFAQMTGLTPDHVRGMIDRGLLPTVKLGRQRLINLALLTQQCLEEEF